MNELQQSKHLKENTKDKLNTKHPKGYTDGIYALHKQYTTSTMDTVEVHYCVGGMQVKLTLNLKPTNFPCNFNYVHYIPSARMME